MGFAVGIDLGTTNTVVAAVRDGMAATFADTRGDRLLPSVVAIDPSGSVTVGRDALDQRVANPKNTIYSIKRLIGRPWTAPEVQKARETLPFALQEGPKGSTLIATEGDRFSIPEISAFVLRQAKVIAESALGSAVDRAVITAPANFNDLQRAATKTAARLAGFEVLRILNEPTAAALAYGPQGSAQERVAVYDLGGGTFDVTVLDLVGNVFEVLATAGDTALGGEDIDLVVAQRMADDLQKRHRFDARKNPAVFSRLRILAEETKRALSTRDEYSVSADDLGLVSTGAPAAWRFRMTRPELEWASLTLVDRTLAVCQQALDAAGAAPREIDRILLVGGATRMPLVGRKVEQFFGRAPVVRINPDEVVALGAAIQAELLDRSRTRTAGPAIHPRISPDSVVQPLPTENNAELADALSLPVIHGKPDPRREPAAPVLPTKRAPPPVPQGRTKVTEIPSARDNAAETAETLSVMNRATREISFPAETHFLPGRTTRSLVFDVPAVPPAGMVDLDGPTRVHRAPEIDLGRPARGRKPPSDRESQDLEGPAGADNPTPSLPFEVASPVPSLAPSLSGAPRLAPSLSGAPSLPPSPSPALSLAPLAGPPVRTTNPLPAPATGTTHPSPATPVRPIPSVDAVLGSALGSAPRKAPLLIDVTPLSLNVETVGGFCDVLIDANTPVPCDRTRSFATASDGQTTVCVRVAQGESRRFTDNTFLGEIELSGVTPAPRGEAPIAVTFEIDADGILNVRARDVKTGRETAARIQLAGTETDPAELQAMRDRQAKRPLAGHH